MKPASRSIVTAVLLLGLAQTSAYAQPARPTGDQHREYTFAPTGAQMPYRIYVPTNWNERTSLPIVLFLHGAGANESTYLDMAQGLLPKLAQQHGYIVVAPLGFTPLDAPERLMQIRNPAPYGAPTT